MIPRVYIGFDTRQREPFEVARASLLEHASGPVSVTPIALERNEEWGLLRRPWIVRHNRMRDIVSDAACSTEFAISRFLTPYLAQTGWAVFVDSDVLFLGDVYELFAQADARFALQVVQHGEVGGQGEKMDGQEQLSYDRKNWSSVMLWNCDHRAHRRMTMQMLQETPGRDLHAFCWLWDNEIGRLAPEWNWLVGVQEKPADPKIAHFTLGGPWFPNWHGAEHDDLWTAARRRHAAAG